MKAIIATFMGIPVEIKNWLIRVKWREVAYIAGNLIISTPIFLFILLLLMKLL